MTQERVEVILLGEGGALSSGTQEAMENLELVLQPRAEERQTANPFHV